MAEMINSDNARALVVDDSMANVLVLSAMLEEYGIQTDTAESGMEAIERACSTKYDIIIMDYLMPDMDGVETTSQIVFLSGGEDKALIIGVSATVDAKVTELFKNAGAESVLKKPVRKEELELKLRQYGIISGEIKEADISKADFDSASFLSTVEGLNYDEGLSVMAGRLDNYMNVLSVSVRNISEIYNKLDVIRSTEQMEMMTMLFHSLKGIFLNIGADKLANSSKVLEFAAKDAENEYVHEHIDSYMEEVLKFHSQLEAVCVSYKENSVGKSIVGSIPKSEFEEKLVRLREYIENFEYIEITDTLEIMISGSEGENKEKLEGIYDCIQDFQYDEALSVLDSMM